MHDTNHTSSSIECLFLFCSDIISELLINLELKCNCVHQQKKDLKYLYPTKLINESLVLMDTAIFANFSIYFLIWRGGKVRIVNSILCWNLEVVANTLCSNVFAHNLLSLLVLIREAGEMVREKLAFTTSVKVCLMIGSSFWKCLRS